MWGSFCQQEPACPHCACPIADFGVCTVALRAVSLLPQAGKPEIILRLSRTLTFLDATWPPGEESGRADEIWLALQVDAALSLHVLQLVDRGEVAVGEDRVAERPEVLG